MNRIATSLQVAGVLVVSGSVALLSLPVGGLVLGTFLVLFGLAAEKDER